MGYIQRCGIEIGVKVQNRETVGALVTLLSETHTNTAIWICGILTSRGVDSEVLIGRKLLLYQRQRLHLL